MAGTEYQSVLTSRVDSYKSAGWVPVWDDAQPEPNRRTVYMCKKSNKSVAITPTHHEAGHA